ncbi:MAG TPA: hypothetical protein DEQ02_06575 [Ruminococcaceae bacterium]|nr:hypothetical protein [Oscillospiraceae bacterium]
MCKYKVAAYYRGDPRAQTVQEPEKAWVYYRVVSGSENNIGLQVQREAALQYAAKHNLVIVGESSDIGNGLRLDRPGVEKMLAAVKSGNVSKVIIRNIDRLGRDVATTLDFIRQIGEYGGIVLTTDGNDITRLLGNDFYSRIREELMRLP